MILRDPFVEAFLNARHEGDLSKTQQTIASRRLSLRDLEKWLGEADSMAYQDVLAVLFDARTGVSTGLVDTLSEDGSLTPDHFRLFFDHSLDRDETDSNGKPVLAFVSVVLAEYLDRGLTNKNGFMKDPECARGFLSRGTHPNRISLRRISIPTTATASLREDDTTLLELFLEHRARL